jgi:hypothetical protein
MSEVGKLLHLKRGELHNQDDLAWQGRDFGLNLVTLMTRSNGQTYQEDMDT